MRHLLLTIILSATVFAQVAVMSVAASEVVVTKPSNLTQTGWKTAARRGTGDTAVGEFAIGPGNPPAGRGSFHMSVGHSAKDPLSKVYLGTNVLSGVGLDKISQLRLSICPHHCDTHDGQPVTVELAVGQSGGVALFTFLPWGRCPTGFYGLDSWREVDLMAPRGAWILTNLDTPDFHGDWAWLVGRFPGATVITPPEVDFYGDSAYGTLLGTGLNIKIGAGKALINSKARGRQWWRESAGCDAYVDKLTVGYRDNNGVEVVKTYDFEPD